MRAATGSLSAQFELLVVGGGIHGAFATLHAARRGLRVALLERADFGGGTSGNSLRIAHGGLRYLGRGDLPRMRESIAERAALMRMAPHLVRPLPCVMPVARRALAPAFAAALHLNDIAVRMVAGAGPAALPGGRVIGRQGMLALADAAWWGSEPAAVLWHDAIITSPDRLLVMVLREAVARGALVRNYSPVLRFLRDTAGRVHGAATRDAVTGEEIEVRASVVLDAAATGSRALLEEHSPPLCEWADGWNVVLRREPPPSGTAIALPHPTEARQLFAVPWHDRILLGTGYAPRRGDDDAGSGSPRAPEAGPLRDRARALVAQANALRPALALGDDEIVLAHAGALPMRRDLGARGVELLDRPIIVDHERAGRSGLAGVVTMIGVKWTTARRVAERAVDLCERRLRGSVTRVDDRARPLGDPGAAAQEPDGYALYGPVAREIAAIARAEPALARPLAPGAGASGAQVAHAFRAEGAVRLSDALMRRSEIAAGGWPGDAVVRGAAAIAAAEAGWSEQRMTEEIGEMELRFARCGGS